MLESILKLLKEQRDAKAKTNVSDQTLRDQAEMLSKFITTEDQLKDFDASKAIISISSNISHEASEAVKSKAKTTAEAKAAAEAKTKADAEAKAKAAAEAKAAADDKPAWADTLLNTVTSLTDEVKSLKSEKVVTARADALTKKMEGLPEAFTSLTSQNFGQLVFKDDEDFNKYLETVKTTGDAFALSLSEQGIKSTPPAGAEIKTDDETGQTSILAKAQEAVKEEAAK